ncbi:MAG TPA: hypothetical protein PLY87_06725 [Planctomycetaceae bacterium]|nr:hypothetical protein [Planctomycetaceae bacterium]HRA87905.1 hypothetical protein [Planctomycetaceae bacterium]
MKKLAVVLGVLLLFSASRSGMVIAEELTPAQIEERDKAFSKSMSKSVLVGSFTMDGKQSAEAPKAERYEIESVVKASDNLWIFTARVKYGKLDTKLPITVPLEWAGDTPMVTLTNANLPGLGEGFSARVLFYEGRYAGTWQHGPVGGHMFGKIEKQKPGTP